MVIKYGDKYMFRLTSLSFITFALILVFSLGTFAQQPTIKDILDRAAVATAQYVDTFRNLLSEESKTIDLYDKKGNVKKKQLSDPLLSYTNCQKIRIM